MIGKIRDTAIGLWPVLKTYVPKTGLIIAVVIAFLVGIIWSYAIDPVSFYNADPRTLAQGWQDQWVLLVADRYAQATSNAVPSPEFEAGIVELLRKVDNPREIINRLQLSNPNVGSLSHLADTAQQGAVSAPPEPGIIATIRPFIVGPIAVTVLFVIGSLLYGFYISPLVVDPIRKRIRGARGTDAAGAAKIHDIKAARAMAEQFAKDDAAAPTSNLGPPVVRHVSIYAPGRAYDDSFSIEDAKKNDEFLGECGAVISETIGTGDQAKVAAIEIWLFDKEDFVRTLTTVFVSEYAYNDPAIRSKLETKGELVLAKPGAIGKLETNTLRLQARIVDMAYGSGPLPPNSYFDKMTLEIQAWRNDGAGAGMAVPAAAPAAPTFAPPPAAPTFAPPPAASTGAPASPFAPSGMPQSPQAAPPSYGGGITPLSPPPLQAPPRRPDDDPFGGTGDFTPVN